MSDRGRTPIRGVPFRLPTEGRARRPSQEHGWSHFEQTVLEGLESLSDAVRDLDARVSAIVLARATEAGAAAERAKTWRWVLGVLAALVVACLAALVRGLSNQGP